MKDVQKEYFDQAYRTGSDVWSHIPYQHTALSMLPQIPKGSFILDLGAGRGLWMQKLLKLGFKVLGIDYIESIVHQVNKDLKLEGLESQGRFVVGDVLDISFTNNSFDMVTDIGTLQHLLTSEWEQYAREVSRVLKPKSWYFNVSLSRETTRFLGWNPKQSDTGAFEKFGVSYYFFTEQEINQLFQKDFILQKQMVRYFDSKSDPNDHVALVLSLFQKKV